MAEALSKRNNTLLELLDRVLDKGVYVAGDIVLSVADVDLIHIDLRLLLCSKETFDRLRQKSVRREPPVLNAVLPPPEEL
jgi:gas vesicle structural protein